MIRRSRIISALVILPVLLAAEPIEVDVCVYGGTSGGIAAAIQVARMKKSAVLLEFDGHLGGLTTGGLGATDIGNKAAIGGIAREFYEQIAAHYEKPEAWKWEQPQKSAALGSGQEKGKDPLVEKTGRPTKWTFEPAVAMGIYRRWIADAG